MNPPRSILAACSFALGICAVAGCGGSGAEKAATATPEIHLLPKEIPAEKLVVPTLGGAVCYDDSASTDCTAETAGEHDAIRPAPGGRAEVFAAFRTAAGESAVFLLYESRASGLCWDLTFAEPDAEGFAVDCAGTSACPAVCLGSHSTGASLERPLIGGMADSRAIAVVLQSQGERKGSRRTGRSARVWTASVSSSPSPARSSTRLRSSCIPTSEAAGTGLRDRLVAHPSYPPCAVEGTREAAPQAVHAERRNGRV